MENEKKLSILIADDEEGLRFSLASILEMEDYNVQTAEDGLEALELVKNNNFDIAFFDIRMPGMNGVDAFKEIKKISPETIVVMMTAYAMNDLIKESINEGAFACISKPFEIEDVLNTVKEISEKPSAVIVSNDKETVSFLDASLKKAGYLVVNENNLDKAYNFIFRRNPHILFIDFSEENIGFINKVKSIDEYYPEIILLDGNDLNIENVKNIKKASLKSLLPEIIKSSTRIKIAMISEATIAFNNLKLSMIAQGYDVSYFQTKDDFYKQNELESYDFIISDILAVHEINILKEKIKDAKIIIVVDYENPEQEKMTEDNIFFIQRPFEVQDFFNLIENNRE